MSEMQDALNQILSNPEAMKQVQSLGEQLGLNKPAPKPEPKNEMLVAMQSLAPLMSQYAFVHHKAVEESAWTQIHLA